MLQFISNKPITGFVQIIPLNHLRPKKFECHRHIRVVFKTELLIIGSKQQLQKLNPCHVRVGNADVLPVPIARDWEFGLIQIYQCHVI